MEWSIVITIKRAKSSQAKFKVCRGSSSSYTKSELKSKLEITNVTHVKDNWDDLEK